MDIFEGENERLLVQALCGLASQEECRNLLEDLLTGREIESLSQRIRVAQLLRQGSTYQEVEERTGASTATIGRVNRCLRYGSGGYKAALDRWEGNYGDK